MNKKTVIPVKSNGEKAYDIIIKPSSLDEIGIITKSVSNAKRAAIVTDSNVAPLYLKRVRNSYIAAGFNVFTFSFTAGEPSKNLKTVTEILNFFCRSGLTRKDIAIALGGGVVGDLTGFAAAIYLRGIDFIQIPTTLLAQVDSSVGGKTGCDLPFGKNLCGAFHTPKAVLIDTEVLKTLDEKHMRDGYSEAIKSGVILVPELFEIFENGNAKIRIDEIVELCVKMKAGVTERDFKENGERTLLNFGHTVGHAIEKYENFSGLTHGEAVSVGMMIITKASQKAGFTEKGTAERLENCLKKYSLPTKTDIPISELAPLCRNDKKSEDDDIKLVLPEKIGKAYVKKIPQIELRDFLEFE